LNRIVARRLRSTLTYVLIALCVGPVVGVLAGALDGLPPFWPAVRGAVAGLLIGAAVGVGEEFVVPRATRRLGFHWLNVIRYGAYILVIQGALLVVNLVRLGLGSGQGAGRAVETYVGTGSFLRDLALAAIVAFVIIALLQLKRLHHASELWRLVTGRYHYPEEEQLVFLFVDLVGSTATAERLGHIGFSRLLRDLFADLSEPILAWRGRVYQHVGDGVIVTWTTRSLSDGTAIRCYFDMVSHLRLHREHYERQYGVAPTIRGAVHVGPVVLTWVGEARKELAYHGDTLNAVSRMVSVCKGLDANLLVSERVRAGFEGAHGIATRPLGEVRLEGKSAPVSLYAVEPAAAPQ
jgi:adenylate cyclase